MSQQFSTLLSVWFQPLARCVGPSGFESSTSGSIRTISEEISAFAFFWKSVCHPLLIKDKNMYQRESKKTRNCLKPDKSSNRADVFCSVIRETLLPDSDFTVSQVLLCKVSLLMTDLQIHFSFDCVQGSFIIHAHNRGVGMCVR